MHHCGRESIEEFNDRILNEYDYLVIGGPISDNKETALVFTCGVPVYRAAAQSQPTNDNYRGTHTTTYVAPPPQRPIAAPHVPANTNYRAATFHEPAIMQEDCTNQYRKAEEVKPGIKTPTNSEFADADLIETFPTAPPTKEQPPEYLERLVHTDESCDAPTGAGKNACTLLFAAYDIENGARNHEQMINMYQSGEPDYDSTAKASGQQAANGVRKLYEAQKATGAPISTPMLTDPSIHTEPFPYEQYQHIPLSQQTSTQASREGIMPMNPAHPPPIVMHDVVIPNRGQGDISRDALSKITG